QDKPGRRFFPRALRDIRPGRPCFCRSGMSIPADIFLAPLATLFDALRSTSAMDPAVSAPRACSRSRESRPGRSPTDAVSNFASTDAKRAHRLLERKELNAASREFPAQRLSPRPLSLQSLPEIPALPEPRHRSMCLPADSVAKRILLKQYLPLFRSRPDSPRRKSAELQCLSTSPQPLPSPFQDYGMPALPVQERCLRLRCSSVHPK